MPVLRVWLVWAPRALALAFCAFLSLFALDSFDAKASLVAQLQAFLVHLLPASVLAVVVVVAWRWPAIGAFAFIAAGTLYAASVGNRPSWVLIVSGPMWLIGVLYLLGARAQEPPRRVRSR